MPNFEPFRRSSTRADGATVTLTRAGALNLSTDAADLLGPTDYVRLFWDRDARILGVQPAQADHPDALRLSASRAGRTVAVKAFAAWAGIEYVDARRWPAYLEGGVLCADLSRPGTPVHSNRSANRSE